MFHKSGTTNSNDIPNTVDVNFPANYSGPITIGFENLNGNSFADSEISGTVSKPRIVPEFPAGSVIVTIAIFSLAIIVPRLARR